MRHKNTQSGSSIALVLVLLIALAIIGAAGWFVLISQKDSDNQSSGQNTEQQRDTEEREEPQLVLQNFGLESLADNAVDTQALRDFKANGLKGLYLFGEPLSGGRLNPAFEFASMKKDANVIAAIDGIVVHIQKQDDTNDYEVFLQPKDKSMWTVGYDHLTNLKVKKGDPIKAGDFIGNASVQNNGLYRFEIQINKDQNGTTTHICPSTLLDPSKSSLLSELTAIQASWESTSGLELYNQAEQNPAGCVKPSLTVAEAEGR